MVISTNHTALQNDFEVLLAQLVEHLKGESNTHQTYIASLNGTRLEKYTVDLLNDLAQDTCFSGSIELVSGQRFPDIIAKHYYGIEVKTTKGNHWRSIGSSVAEGTRIEGIERIYMLFGKLASPIDFRCRPYQECLSGVVVTHSPRYTIDMELKEGNTFFDKLGISYDDLRRSADPTSRVVDYFKRQLKPGQTTWWLGQHNESKPTNIIVRLWSSLDKEEREIIRAKGFCLFPELLSKRQDKYNRMLLWLSTSEGIVSGSLRDNFTAGGRCNLVYQNRLFSLPQIIYTLKESLQKIKLELTKLNVELLEETWGRAVSEDRYAQWVTLVATQAKQITDFPLKTYLLSQ